MPTQVRIFAMPKSLGETLAGGSSTLAPRSVPQHINAQPPPVPQPVAINSDTTAMSEKPRSCGITFAGQDDLPRLPIPDLANSCQKYLAALKPLQTPREHAETKIAVQDFLRHDGPELQSKLRKYAEGKPSYIEQFCKCSCVDMHSILLMLVGFLPGL